MAGGNDQDVRGAGEALERIGGLSARVEGHVDRHFAFELEIDAAAFEDFRGKGHFRGAFRNGVTEGREGDKGRARLQAEVARDIGGAFGDGGEIFFIRPFLHQRIADEDDLALVQKRGDACCAMGGISIEHVVDEAEHIGGLAGRAGDEAIAMTMSEHESREHVTVTRSEAVHIVAVEAFALEAVVEEILVGVQVAGGGRVHDFQLVHCIPKAFGFEFLFHISIAAYNDGLTQTRTLVLHSGAQHAGIVTFREDHAGLGGTGARVDAAQD